ncbi:UDP-glycosyltransferase 71K1-like [Durio zibethinus]|uniref:UDP-glycosyltransferase 71K1-like n=1 Tax=Durio zibethinus TaxID=66656 RepID=A0A6P6A5L3_DURZI|nr:UDP-glycosyltransferase 71K1-like [Durio zibethinus]
MRKAKLIFVPIPGIGHLAPILEFAKWLFDRYDQFSLHHPIIVHNFSVFLGDTPSLDLFSKSSEKVFFFFSDFVESHKSHVRDAIINHVLPDSTSNSVPLVGLVLDFFCTAMIDVGKELCIPLYLFFTSTAAFLSLMLYLPSRHDQIGHEFEESDPESIIPGYAGPVPTRALPSFLFNKHVGYLSLLNYGRRFKEVEVLLNTLEELESHALKSLMEYSISTPPIYPLGPLIGKGQKILFHTHKAQNDEIMKWLDHQPPSSVVFLCFGSLGSFDEPQLIEIASGLERSGFRLLWSVRKDTGKRQSQSTKEIHQY